MNGLLMFCNWQLNKILTNVTLYSPLTHAKNQQCADSLKRQSSCRYKLTSFSANACFINGLYKDVSHCTSSFLICLLGVATVYCWFLESFHLCCNQYYRYICIDRCIKTTVCFMDSIISLILKSFSLSKHFR